jgi:hypothetical protein
MKGLRFCVLGLFALILPFVSVLADGDEPVESEDGSDGKTTVEFFDEPVPVNNVVIILDISASMQLEDPGAPAIEEFIETGPNPGDGAKEAVSDPRHIFKGMKGVQIPQGRSRIARAKYELCKLIYNLPDDIMFNVIFFNQETSLLQTRKMIKSTKKNRQKAIYFTLKQDIAGGTRTDLALEEAFKIRNVDMIHLISDGAPTKAVVTPAEQQAGDWFADTNGILNRVKELNKDRKITINTMGFDSEGQWPAGKGAAPSWVADSNKRISTFVKFLEDLASQNNRAYRSIK